MMRGLRNFSKENTILTKRYANLILKTRRPVRQASFFTGIHSPETKSGHVDFYTGFFLRD